LNIVCIASFEKGHDFLRQVAKLGHRVILMTSASLETSAKWPMESISEIYHIPDKDKVWDRMHTLYGLAYLARTRQIDRIVPLDDFDLEMAAFLREHLRIPGMGETTVRYFRDKLAMRMKAKEAGIPVPRFCAVINHHRVNEFLSLVPAPWLLKPRSSAGAIGIKRCDSASEVWDLINGLGDEQSFYLLEEFIPGDICHVDSIVSEREILFAQASQYGRPPLEVSHGGGIFTTQIIERDSPLEHDLLTTNQRVLSALGLLRGVSHTEYIVSHATGEIYFLETSARVGGAHIADLVEAATGVNLWAEWANIEVLGGTEPYTLPNAFKSYAALVVSLARQEYPDLSTFADDEVCWRMHKQHHVGLIVRSPDRTRVQQLLDSYVAVIKQEFHASAPPKNKATE
jgi:biotin carboxylase